jgi:glycosyltransferase involved in cell wall biosynthesis
MKRVVFLTANLTQYRIPFHNGVRETLSASGIEYDVVYGQPSKAEASKANLGTLSWGKPIVNRYIQTGARALVWQPALGLAWRSDLVVLGQENRLLVNYPIQITRRICGPKVALWGHGRTFQADIGQGFAESWKRFWATRCDWWFAYTDEARKIVEGYGYAPERITVFNNAVDTSGIQRLANDISADELEEYRRRIGVEGQHVGVYVGGIYGHKRVDFLIQSAIEIRRRVPDFVLVVVGGGIEGSKVATAAATKSWIRYLGPLYGREKVTVMKLGKVFVMPGLVGLAILDCAAVGLPIVTTAYPYHSPEVAYLVPGESGLIVKDWMNPVAYADAVASLFRDDPLRAKLSAGAIRVRSTYTIERMIESFSSGVIQALNTPRQGGLFRGAIERPRNAV